MTIRLFDGSPRPTLDLDRVGRGSSAPFVRKGARSRRAGAAPEWVSYHIFYHGSLDRVLSQLVLPVVRDLWCRRWISRFFFIRYGLGGPHLRLRLSCTSKRKGDIEDAVRRKSTEFFARWPSATRLSDDEIRRQNRGFPANDAASTMDAVYPNNSVVELPFQPEVERYGGHSLIEPSLDFFCVSSAYALQLVAQHEAEPRSRRLFRALQALLRQALGLAVDEDELPLLVAYGLQGSEPDPSPLMARADQEFERRREDYVGLVCAEIESSRDLKARRRLTDYLLTDAAQRLKRRIREAGEPVRRKIATSQLHMTSNRLGILNPEEDYLGHILRRALRDIADANRPRPLFSDSPGGHGSRRNGLAALVPVSLTQLTLAAAEEDPARKAAREDRDER